MFDHIIYPTNTGQYISYP